MNVKKKIFQEMIAKELGASRSIPISEKIYGTPLGWIEQANALHARLVSTGGRPSDPTWEIKRLVPFKRENWDKLSKIAEMISSKERKIGPSQLSAILIERQLSMRTIANSEPSITVQMDWNSTIHLKNSSGGQNLQIDRKTILPKMGIPLLEKSQAPQPEVTVQGAGNYFWDKR